MPPCAAPTPARAQRQSSRGAAAMAIRNPSTSLTNDIESSRADGEACAELTEARPRARQRDIAEIADADHEYRQGGPTADKEGSRLDEGVLKRLDTGLHSRGDHDLGSFGGVRSKFTASRL